MIRRRTQSSNTPYSKTLALVRYYATKHNWMPSEKPEPESEPKPEPEFDLAKFCGWTATPYADWLIDGKKGERP